MKYFGDKANRYYSPLLILERGSKINTINIRITKNLPTFFIPKKSNFKSRQKGGEIPIFTAKQIISRQKTSNPRYGLYLQCLYYQPEDSCHGTEILLKEKYHGFDIGLAIALMLVYSVGGLTTFLGMTQQHCKQQLRKI